MLRAALAFFIAGILTGNLSSSGFAPAHAATCSRPWLFFDLGNTLIDTRDWSHVTHLPGAKDYLIRLKAAGYSLGLIANIPEDWGTTEAEKLQALKANVAKDWAEAEPFDWDLFTCVLVPLKNAERKPAPALFLRAQESADGCPTIYQGEDSTEVQAANSLGMRSYQVGQPAKPFFLPETDFVYFLSF